MDANSFAAFLTRITDNARYKALRDYQQAWYWNMLTHIVINGALAVDGKLWAIAGASTERFWTQNSGAVLGCFRQRQLLGRTELYCDNGLQVKQKTVTIGKHPRKPRDRDLLRFIDSKELQTFFEDGYKLYPLHKAKLAGEKAYYKAVLNLVKLTGVTHSAAAGSLNSAIRAYAHSPEGTRPDKQYLPHMSSWLNKGRYLDNQTEWDNGDATDGYTGIPHNANPPMRGGLYLEGTTPKPRGNTGST